MASLGSGQKEQAKALKETIENIIAEAEKNKDEARRNGTPLRKTGVFIPESITIRHDVLKRLKEAGVEIATKPII